MQVGDVDVFVGIDVGKSEHWATALARGGKTLFDKALPNDETRLRDLYEHLGSHGRVLVGVDQPATIGALAVAVAQDMGVSVAYLPGLSMRRIAAWPPVTLRPTTVTPRSSPRRSARCRTLSGRSHPATRTPLP